MAFFRANAAILGGTVDNAVIGGTTAAAGTFTDLDANGTGTNSIGTSGSMTVTSSNAGAGALTLSATGGGTAVLTSAGTGPGAVTVSTTGGGAGAQALVTSNGTGAEAVKIEATGTNGGITLAPDGNGTIACSNKRLTNLAAPTGPGDAATKTYVDNNAGGETWNTPSANGAGQITLNLSGGGVSDSFLMDMGAATGNVTGTLADGSADGQLCNLILAEEGSSGFTGGTHTCTITVTNYTDATGDTTNNALVFDHEGQSALLVWSASAKGGTGSWMNRNSGVTVS